MIDLGGRGRGKFSEDLCIYIFVYGVGGGTRPT